MADKRVELVLLLEKKTSSRELPWTVSDQFPNKVSVEIGSNTISITETKSNRRNSSDLPDYDVRVVDINMRVVEQFSDVSIYEETGESIFDRLQATYLTARRLAMGADEVLDDIIGKLLQ